jgi:hypothetical protein
MKKLAMLVLATLGTNFVVHADELMGQDSATYSPSTERSHRMDDSDAGRKNHRVEDARTKGDHGEGIKPTADASKEGESPSYHEYRPNTNVKVQTQDIGTSAIKPHAESHNIRPNGSSILNVDAATQTMILRK